MSKDIIPQERPTFKVAHLYRSHALITRETFMAFQKTYVEIVTTIANCRDEDELWLYVRSLFDFDDYADVVPINAANLSIIFNPVQLMMNAMALDWNRDISIQKRIKPFVYTIQAARALIASQLNVEPEFIAFMRNGSDPNAVINNGMTFGHGDEVVVWNENHPTDGEVAWYIRKDRFPNINVVVLDLEGEEDEDKIVQKFLSKVNKQTRLVTFSEVSHLSGMHLPAKLLVDKIHKRNKNVHVHVDGAQTWGSFDHDLKDLNCDSYSGGSHKWFLGPKETGILYMKKESVPNFAPKDIGYNGEMAPPPSMHEGEPLPLDCSRFEMIGQRNDTNLIGLLYTADLMGLIGYQRIGERIKALATRLRTGLNKVIRELPQRVFEVETPPELSQYHGIIVIKFADEYNTSADGRRRKNRKKGEAETEQPELSVVLYDKLYEDYNIGVSTKKGNRMRFSPHIYNTEDHMDRAVAAIRFELMRILK